MQVDSIKTRVCRKRLCCQRLKLQYDDPHSNCAFNSNFENRVGSALLSAYEATLQTALTAPCFQRLKLRCDDPPSNFALNSNLRRYKEGGCGYDERGRLPDYVRRRRGW